MTAATDLIIGLGYAVWPVVWVLFRGDRKPTKTGRDQHEHI